MRLSESVILRLETGIMFSSVSIRVQSAQSASSAVYPCVSAAKYRSRMRLRKSMDSFHFAHAVHAVLMLTQPW